MSISPINMTTVNPYSAPDQSQTQGSSQAHGSEPSLKQVQHAVDQINNVVQNSNKDVQFKLDHSNGKVVVQVMDTQNHQVIRQIPSKETMAIAQALDKLQGLIIRNHA